MKKLSLFALSAALLSLAACSSDDINPGSGSEDNGIVAEGQSGYLSVNINLPTTSSSSSRANDSYGDGVASEYQVNNAMLVLFTGSDELEATVHSAYDLNLQWNNKDPQNSNITEQANQVIEVTKGSNYTYALVILNRPSIVSLNGTTLSINNTSMTGKTLSDLTKAGLTDSSYKGFLDGNNGIMMTNTVLVNAAGTTGASFTTNSADANTTPVHILVNVTNDIWETETLAKTNSAVEIIVERAVAKVSVVDNTSSNNKITLNGSETTMEMVAWNLTNTNKSSYLIRNWGQTEGSFNTGNAWLEYASNGSTSELSSNPYRFAGKTYIDASQTNTQTLLTPLSTPYYYRTYWGLDCNYSLDNYDSDNNAHTSTYGLDVASDPTEMQEYEYCLENTFDVEHMTLMNTTCAIIKAKVGDGSTFYTYGADRSVTYTESTILNKIASAASTYVGIKQALANALNAVSSSDDDLATAGVATDKDIYFSDAALGTVSSSSSDAYSNINVASLKITYTDNSSNEETSVSVVDADLTTLNNNIAISEYTGGYCYYRVKVQHFGDDLTPWYSTETPKPSVNKTYYIKESNGDYTAITATTAQSTSDTVYYVSGTDADGNNVYTEITSDQKSAIENDSVEGSYPSLYRNKNYLGRYGVLRNNWYELDVTGYYGLGDATNPAERISKEDTPDDELSAYIAVQINVLSWAKRTQTTVLGSN